MSDFQATGIIHTIGETNTFGSNGFTKREFVIKLTGERENDQYPNYINFELIKDRCSMIDAFQPGQEITVQFNLTGRLWQPQGKPEKCFNALQAWRISAAQAQQNTMDSGDPGPTPDDFDQMGGGFDDIPF